MLGGPGVGRAPHQSEVLGAVVGDHENQPAAEARVVIHRVLDAGPPGLTSGARPRDGRPGSADLGGGRATAGRPDEGSSLVRPTPEAEALVGLLGHQHVGRGVRAPAVAPELVGAHGLVDPGVEDGGVSFAQASP